MFKSVEKYEHYLCIVCGEVRCENPICIQIVYDELMFSNYHHWHDAVIKVVLPFLPPDHCLISVTAIDKDYVPLGPLLLSTPAGMILGSDWIPAIPLTVTNRKKRLINPGEVYLISCFLNNMQVDRFPVQEDTNMIHFDKNEDGEDIIIFEPIRNIAVYC